MNILVFICIFLIVRKIVIEILFLQLKKEIS